MVRLTGFYQNSSGNILEKLFKRAFDIWLVVANAFNTSTPEYKTTCCRVSGQSTLHSEILFKKMKIKQPKTNKQTKTNWHTQIEDSTWLWALPDIKPDWKSRVCCFIVSDQSIFTVRKGIINQVVVMCAFISSIWKAETGESRSSLWVWFTEQVKE